MKRTVTVFAAMAAAVAMTFALAGIALADAGPHGGYGPGAVAQSGWSDTDKCAGCHRAHTGGNTYLLTYNTEDELCKSCHQAGAGAGTDVWAGVYTTSSDPNAVQAGGATADASVVGNGLNGGGFDYAILYSGTTNTPTGTALAVTSKHDVGQVGTAWGGGVASGAGNVGPGYLGELECSGCHNPHGSNNYRILNGKPLMRGTTTAESWVTSSPPMVDGIVNSPEIPATAKKNYTLGLNTAYDRGISDFCANCHTNYLITRSSGGGGDPAIPNNPRVGGGQMYDWDNDTVLEETWRHSVGSKYVYKWTGTAWVTQPGHDRTNSTLSTAYSFHLRGAASDAAVAAAVTAGNAGVGLMPTTTASGNQGRITCLTCHNAHGTAAVATGYAANAGVVPGSSAILFLDGRGMCQNCHNQKN